MMTWVTDSWRCQVPPAIVADPLADREFPAALAVVSFSSHGVESRAICSIFATRADPTPRRAAYGNGCSAAM